MLKVSANSCACKDAGKKLPTSIIFGRIQYLWLQLIAHKSGREFKSDFPCLVSKYILFALCVISFEVSV
jgi:hypothetical protein